MRPGQPPFFKHPKRFLYISLSSHFLGQYDRIFYILTGSLSHIGRGGMRRIAHQQHFVKGIPGQRFQINNIIPYQLPIQGMSQYLRNGKVIVPKPFQ
jgi:hypothetical protein